METQSYLYNLIIQYTKTPYPPSHKYYFNGERYSHTSIFHFEQIKPKQNVSRLLFLLLFPIHHNYFDLTFKEIQKHTNTIKPYFSQLLCLYFGLYISSIACYFNTIHIYKEGFKKKKKNAFFIVV